MKPSTIMKSLLVLQQEAVPGESINNLVSREYEFYLPKRIRGTNFFFDVIFPAQVAAYVWSSYSSLSRSAPTPALSSFKVLQQAARTCICDCASEHCGTRCHHSSSLPCHYVSWGTSERLRSLLTYPISFIVLTTQRCQWGNIITVTSLRVWHIEATQ